MTMTARPSDTMLLMEANRTLVPAASDLPSARQGSVVHNHYKGLQNLQPLLLANRKFRNGSIRIHFKPKRSASAISLRRAAIELSLGFHSDCAPISVFSRTVRFSASVKCWCTMPIPASIAARIACAVLIL